MNRTARKGYLYLVHSPAQEAFKVGFATNIAQRLANLQSGNPSPLSLILVVPVEADAEITFHALMRKHRIAREWYPDDDASLAFLLCSEIQELWGDLVIEATGWPDWPTNGNEWENPAGIYVTAKVLRREIPKMLREIEAAPPDADESV